MPHAPLLTEGNFTFRDLNKNGRLDPYEDPRRPIEERVEDVLSQMTLEEKAGLMLHTIIGVNQDGSLMEQVNEFNRTPTSEMAILRLSAPYEPREGFLGRLRHGLTYPN